jgi:peptide chain release factor 2
VNYGGIFDFDVKSERLGAVSKELEDPKIWDEPQRAQELSRERKQLEGVVGTLTQLQSDLADSAELFAMARSESDDATVRSVQTDVAKIARVVDDLEFRRMFNQPLDPANCFIDIQAGSGGT